MLSTSPYSDLQVPEIAVQSTSVCSILSWHVWKVPATDGASIWLSLQHPEQFERATLQRLLGYSHPDSSGSETQELLFN